ncbi:MAG: 3-methyl-2-oxobutanoate hydroxymethyltransferase [Gammaproteobacteria bacterium]|nr:3-methyl-2-oxobutanoate hydroxymethyltransferase [Gammaproteobacteria bacterium]
MSAHTEHEVHRITVTDLQAMKKSGEKIVCLTAYDASFAHVLDQAGVDVVLVGDSLGMVIQGHDSTLPVTVSDMLYHGRAVSRGLKRALLMVDMPYLSYTSPQQALQNAGSFMQQANAQMVKLEGGAEQAEIVSCMAQNGIPVCAHLGLQPQRVHKLGGYRVQGREQDAAEAMLEEAGQLEQAGADMMLLECVPQALADRITAALTIPVIGIGAGNGCDGQILVLYDILGISVGRIPRFSKDFMVDADGIEAAVRAYVEAVKNKRFPGSEHAFS